MSIDVTLSATLSERVAEEIRALMARRRVRQTQLAREIGVNDQWLSVRLRGVQEIGLNDLARIADGLGVDPSALITGTAETVKLRKPNLAQKPRSDRPLDNRPRTQNRGARRTQLTRDFRAA